MPGHSLVFKHNRWRISHDPDFKAVHAAIGPVHQRFVALGAKHKPRPFLVGGKGYDADLKDVLFLEAGILEALQRWQMANPNNTHDPVSEYDYDQVTEFLVELNVEHGKHQNRDGSYSAPYQPPKLPPWSDPSQYDAYDDWVRDRVVEFVEELKLKPGVAHPAPMKFKAGTDSLAQVAKLLKQIPELLKNAHP